MTLPYVYAVGILYVKIFVQKFPLFIEINRLKRYCKQYNIKPMRAKVNIRNIGKTKENIKHRKFTC
jgi:hypothetical protein